MRKHSHLRALALAALLSTPFVQAALADEPEQQAMRQITGVDPAAGLTGPYDMLAPTVGD